jgi:hypothetical protein
MTNGISMESFKEIQCAIHPDFMSFIESFCRRVIDSRPPNQIIARQGDVYINRWMLARKGIIPVYDDPAQPFLSVATMASELENLYLHEFKRNDREDPHCHPWRNASLVVSGSYTESVYDHVGNFLYDAVRRPGDIVLREANSVHAIQELIPGTLSLFATMPKEKDWGFWKDERFIHWQNYAKNSVLPASRALN